MDLNSLSDAELLQKYLQGEMSAFEALESRHRGPVFAWLVSSLGNRSDAEDLYQDLWFRVIKNADSFKDVSFKAWLWKIARNRVIDFRRKKRPELVLDASGGGDDDQPMVDRIASGVSAPADNVEMEDLTGRVMDAVKSLPESQREVFLMRMESHMSFNEISEILNIPLNTALGRMHDAMNKIRNKLKEVL
jgi:RNA polymerase sigma-70 factor, ECF subfamily